MFLSTYCIRSSTLQFTQAHTVHLLGKAGLVDVASAHRCKQWARLGLEEVRLDAVR